MASREINVDASVDRAQLLTGQLWLTCHQFAAALEWQKTVTKKVLRMYFGGVFRIIKNIKKLRPGSSEIIFTGITLKVYIGAFT